MLVSTAILTSLNFMYGPIELSNGKKRIKREREKGGGWREMEEEGGFLEGWGEELAEEGEKLSE